MNRYYYDLHLHSCLSPCGDNENTPNNLVGMGVLAGLQIMALTDHNTCRNCPAFFEAAKRQGIVPVAGMELTTAEDIHVVCLFPTLEAAMEFNDAVEKCRVRLPNRTDIFGDQLIMDGEDNVVATEPDLLPNATTISLGESVPLVERYGGVCYPAHIDRQANGILAILGTMPKTPAFSCVELHDGALEEEYRVRFGLQDKRFLVGSDAHYLWDVRDKERFLELDDEPYSGQKVRESLIACLRGTL